jgi:2,4-dienoyl-CoA reductase-like NADH-dependent reductase (Old Yellow Enzyme family)
MKISATENNNAMVLGEQRGNTIEDAVKVCKWLETEGVDAIHVSGGSFFPHPRNPAGDLPIEDFVRVYDNMISSGKKTFRNFLLLRNDLTGRLFRDQWVKQRGNVIEGLNLPDAAAIRKAVSIPVICTGGFQTASVIRNAISSGQCDAVSMARTLIANRELPQMFERGLDVPPVPCTYCNKCLVNAVENPLGCYDDTRFTTREAMIHSIMSVFDPAWSPDA